MKHRRSRVKPIKESTIIKKGKGVVTVLSEFEDTRIFPVNESSPNQRRRKKE